MNDTKIETPPATESDEEFQKNEEQRKQIRRSNLEQLKREQYDRERAALRPTTQRIYKSLDDD